MTYKIMKFNPKTKKYINVYEFDILYKIDFDNEEIFVHDMD